VTIDLAAVEAIDVHVRTEILSRGRTRRSPSPSTRSGCTYAARAVRKHTPPRPVLFGSDYPLITPDRWLADFADADFKDEVRPLILKENAARLLGLAG
jgi:predicted TIM-barrel fold metal-dependent hydrolase